MKKLMLSWLVLLIGYQSLSQTQQVNQINIPSFTVKNILPGNIDSWITTPGALLMTAQKVPGSRVLEPRMVIQIRSNGAIICGSSPANPRPVDPFDVRTFNTADLVGMLGNCHELKEGSYTICVQFYNIDKIAISREVCKDFTVEATVTEYSPPVLISPNNEKTFSVDELQRPVTFRWTPLVPKPKEPVTYRLKVWQLMQGQNSTTAMRSNQPIVTKDVDNINQVVVNGVITGPCRPPYLCDFIWSVQALNRNGKPLGNNNGLSEPYTFKAAENNQPGDCQPPVLTAPANNRSFKASETGQPITFRWTPIVPKPKDPVTYRLKVWQLMQGQNGAQAMRTNKPIVTKDVDNISEVTVNGVITGPCRPPYLCDFIWQVQALNREGNPVGCKEGMSEPFSFKMQNNIDIEIDSLKVGCCENGKQSVYISVKNNLTNAVKITAITYKINGAGAAIPLTPLTPVLPVNITGNGSQVFTSSVNCIDNATWLKFLVDAEDIADPDNKETEVASDTLHCICNTCDSVKIDVNQKDSIKLTGNNLIVNNTISVSPKPVKSVNAELVYFEYVPESEDCMLCNKDPKTFGNFISAETGIVSPTVTAPHTVNWNIGSVGAQVITNQNINFTISMPPTVKCCAAQVRWCIRYVITFADCTVCNKLVCYTYNKKCDCK